MDNEVVINLQKVIDKLLPEAILKGLERVGQEIENETKLNTVPVDDGPLRASITHQIVGDDKVEIGSNLEYAPYVHEGTGIYAKNGTSAKQIPWTYMRADGSFITTSGQKPVPFLKNAVDNKMSILPKIFENLLEGDSDA